MHPGLESVKNALEDTAYCAGTVEVPAKDLRLYYHPDPKDLKVVSYVHFTNTSPSELDDLVKASQPATFGRGDRDILDESYRKAVKLDVDRFNATFELSASKIMDIVSAELLDGKDEGKKFIRPELYKLNVYDKGAFFKAHKDTPRAENMFASLVIVFPTPHEGGALLLRHKDQEWTFDSAKELSNLSSPSVGYVAFYSDVEHEVTPVTSGHRVTLTYNLYIEATPPLSAAPLLAQKKPGFATLKAALHELLSDSSFLPEGGRLGFGLSHQYPYVRSISKQDREDEADDEDEDYYDRDYDDRDRGSLAGVVNVLKGSDSTLHKVCQDLGLRSSVRVVYDCEDGCLVSLDRIVDLSKDGQFEDNPAEVLQDSYRGEIIVGGDWTEADPRLAVEWVSEMSGFNKLSTTYIGAFGNQAQTDHLYGDMCLIVDVGTAGDRKTL